jgi:glutathione-regulated potassium-efflux system ancillary protein KefF
MADVPVLLLFAHPYPDRSRANRLLLEAVESLSGVTVRSLYDLYPTFDIDVRAEQDALRGAQIVVWQHPMYWYSVPSLFKHWFDKVLIRGFAYGEGGKALWGKRCLWVVTTGGDDRAIGTHRMHRRPFSEFSPVVEQTALFCGMHWEEPLVVHGAHRAPREDLEAAAVTFRERLLDLVARVAEGGLVEGPEPAIPLPAVAQTDHGGGGELDEASSSASAEPDPSGEAEHEALEENAP